MKIPEEISGSRTRNEFKSITLTAVVSDPMNIGRSCICLTL